MKAHEGPLLFTPMASVGRLHSLTNSCFWDAKLQRRLYDDELVT